MPLVCASLNLYVAADSSGSNSMETGHNLSEVSDAAGAPDLVSMMANLPPGARPSWSTFLFDPYDSAQRVAMEKIMAQMDPVEANVLMQGAMKMSQGEPVDPKVVVRVISMAKVGHVSGLPDL